jgi:hypothetical protein
MSKIEKLDDLLKTTGEQLIDYSDDSNSKFFAIKDHVSYLNLIFYFQQNSTNKIITYSLVIA